MVVSRWHQEEPKYLIKSDMDLEEARKRNQMRPQGNEKINNVRGKGV